MGNELAEKFLKIYRESGYDATPVLAIVKADPNPANKTALRLFWSRLTLERLWIGDPGVGGKRQGWAYPTPAESLGLLGLAKVITIGELGERTSSKSNRVDSVLGLVRSIRANGYTGPIFVKARIMDKEVWEAILKEAKTNGKE